VDLATREVSRDQLLAAEAKANEIVFTNRAVVVSFEDAAAAIGLRKPPARDGQIRIVTIDGADRSACGGTHVRATGEIGPVLLGRQDRMHGNARIEFLCGSRAVRRARADYDALARLATVLGVAAGEVASRVDDLVHDQRDAERARKKTLEELAAMRIEKMRRENLPDAAGIHWLVERRGEGSMDDLRTMAQAAMNLPCTVFLGVLAHTSQVLMASSEDSGVDSGKQLRAALTAAGGRGGGSARLAQGSVPERMLQNVIDSITRYSGEHE
jgi:alanyl-tRNA synthetase